MQFNLVINIGSATLEINQISLGLPYLFDTDRDGNGIGNWGLMADMWGKLMIFMTSKIVYIKYISSS